MGRTPDPLGPGTRRGRAGTIPAALLCLASLACAAGPTVGADSPPREQDGRLLGRLAGAGGTAVSFSRDGRLILTAGGNAARVWDAATLKPVTPPLGHDRVVYSARFSPDGRAVVTASADGTARVWDAATGRPVAPPLRHRRYPTRASFSPDGAKIVTAGEGAATIWDARTGEQVKVLPHRGSVWSAAFSPDGRTLLTTTVGVDQAARVWNVGTAKASIESLAGVDDAVFSPDGRLIATVEGHAVRVRDAATGRPVTREMDHDTSITSVAFSPDGSRIVTAADGYGRVWDAATGEPVTKPLAKFRVDRMNVGVFSPNGKWVLIAGEGATAAVWDVGTGKRVMTIGDGFDSVVAAAFSPDGTRVAVGCWMLDDKVGREFDTAVWQVAPDVD